MWPIMSPSFHIAGGEEGKSTCSAGNKEDCALAALALALLTAQAACLTDEQHRAAPACPSAAQATLLLIYWT